MVWGLVLLAKPRFKIFSAVGGGQFGPEFDLRFSGVVAFILTRHAQWQRVGLSGSPLHGYP